MTAAPAREGLLRHILGNRLTLLIGLLPVALGLRLAGASDVLVFVASALAVVPLAGLIGDATEQVAHYIGLGSRMPDYSFERC